MIFKEAVKKLEGLVKPLKEELKGKRILTLSSIKELSNKYKANPYQITYISQVILGKELTKLAERKYGRWLTREELVKKAYVPGMDVEIYDECNYREIKGKIVERKDKVLVIETVEGKREEVDIDCIPEWGLVYVMKESSLEKSAVVRKCKEEDKRSADDVWCVYSEKGRLLGRYRTKEEAEKRLRQVEYFKRKKKD